MYQKQFTPEMRACLDKCYKMGMNLARNPTPEAKEEYKQAERERHRQIYKENPEAEKQRNKLWAGQETECKVCNVKLKMGSLRDHLQSKKHTSKVENTHTTNH